MSTTEQGDSGLGLEAQRQSVQTFAAAQGFQIVGKHRDIESGKHNDRPGLHAALDQAKADGATLLIAKLDRLSRNAAFIMALRDSAVPFVACDMPEANTLTVGIMATMAQAEREAISRRTREALAALKARGKKLGKPENLTAEAQAKGRAERTAKALRYYNGAFVTAKALRSEGWSLARIADTLNEAGHRTPRGKLYEATTVRRLLMMAERGMAERESENELRAVRRALPRGFEML